MDAIKMIESQKWDIIAEHGRKFIDRLNAIKRTFNSEVLESICVSDNDFSLRYYAYKRLREIDKKTAKRIMRHLRKTGEFKEIIFGKYAQYMKTLIYYKGHMVSRDGYIYDPIYEGLPPRINFMEVDRENNVRYKTIRLSRRFQLRIIKLDNGRIKLRYIYKK